MEEKQKIRTVCCSVCGHTDFAFVPEYHKSLGARFFGMLSKAGMYLFLILIAAEIFGGGFTPNKTEYDRSLLSSFIVCAVVYLICFVIQILIESKTHTKAICKHCLHQFLID